MGKEINIRKFSEVDIQITEKQCDFIIDIVGKITYMMGKIEGKDIFLSPNIFTRSLLNDENVSSSQIEGTSTNNDDMYYWNRDGIRDKYAWEGMNLYHLYIKSFEGFSNGTLDFDKEDICHLHRSLFDHNKDQNNLYFDPSGVIQKVKPGKIIIDDKTPNWIGRPGGSIEDATLILIKPSQKMSYLEDLCAGIRELKNSDIDLITKIKGIIKFHPIFEAIHPFGDGNGRLGRLLLTCLFPYLNVFKYNWIFMSNEWSKQREEYLTELKYVQTTNKWVSWTYFFIGSLKNTVDNITQKIHKIIDLVEKIQKLDSFGRLGERKVLEWFFKYPILNKTNAIDRLINKEGIAQSSAYKIFDRVAKLISAKNNNGLFYFDELLDIVNQS